MGSLHALASLTSSLRLFGKDCHIMVGDFMRSLLPALLFLAPTTLAAAGSSMSAPLVGTMAVVFPFGTSQKMAVEIVAASGGAIVASTHLDNVVVAVSSGDDFQARARAAGALFFFNAAGLCGDQEVIRS